MDKNYLLKSNLHSIILCKRILYKHLKYAFFALLIINTQISFSQINKVENGIINISTNNFENNDIINLNGKWEFYYNKQYSEINNLDSKKYIEVPFDWKRFGYEGKGYALYRLKIIMPDNYDDFMLKIGRQSTAYNLYFNRDLVHSIGLFGTDNNSSTPNYEIVNKNIPNNIDTLEVVVEISNFHYRKGGIWEKIYIGKRKSIEHQNTKQLVFDIFLVGALLVLFMYHFILFFQLKTNGINQYKIPLYFSLLALLALVRVSSTGQMLFMILIPKLSWPWLVRFEFIPFFMMVAIGIKYIQSIYPQEFSKKIINLTLILCGIPSILTLFIPIYYSSFFIVPMQIISILILFYFIYGNILAIKRKRETSKLVLFAFIIIIVSVINDILNSQNFIKTIYIFPIGVFFYFIIQAVSLSKLLANSFQKVNTLSSKLLKSNEELEQKVEERTKEIKTKHTELENSFKNLQKLNRIFQKITENYDVTSIINDVYENINELMDASGFGIGIYNEKDKTIGFLNYIENENILPYEKVAVADINSLTVWCFNNEKEVLIKDYKLDSSKFVSKVSIPDHGEIPQSLIYIPLISNKRKIGVITVQSFKKNAYTNYHLDLLRNIAIYTSIALENADAFKQIESLSVVASKTTNYVIIIGKDDKIEWVNAGFTKLTGYKFNEAIGKMSSQVIGGEKTEIEVIKQIDNAIFKTKKSYKGIITNYKKDGSTFKAAIDLSPVLDNNGNLLKYFVIGRDISEREKYRKELKIQRDIAIEQKNKIEKVVNQLKESEGIIREKNIELNQLSHVVSTTDNAVMIISPNGEIEWVNKGFTKLYGFTFEEFKTKSSNLFEVATNEEVIAPIKEAMENKQSLNYDAELKTKGGNKIWVNTTWTPILDENNELRKLIAIDADISKQKEAEENLRLNNIEISKQHKHIKDSIIYAQRIQQALLSPLDLIENVLEDLRLLNIFNAEYFILYKPKDIVSGDFYWAKFFSQNLFFVAADCTGHGVPGAFMSALGISFLNDIVNNKENLEPNIILNKLRTKLITTLRQSDYNTDNKDGMDISLCRINLQTMELEYAGAYQPLYLVRSSEGQPALHKFSGNRMPIGVYIKSEKSFNKTTIKIENNDVFYFGSDGYVSQFGGVKNETFKSRRLEKLLLEINHLPMDEQKLFLDKTITDWQQDIEQIDDILIFGVKINSIEEKNSH